MSFSRHSSSLIVNLNLLKENISSLRKLYPTNKILFMVKADAYGHGLVPIVDFANRECSVNEFGLASLSEALELRRCLPEMKADLFVFSELCLDLENSMEHYLTKRIIPVIASIDDLDFILSDQKTAALPLCLKFDTGMGRLGIAYDDVELVVERLQKAKRIKVAHVMSHFANAALSMKNNKKNLRQQERFRELLLKLKTGKIEVKDQSLSNSGALEQGIGREYSHIRPGLMLFGPSSLISQQRNNSAYKGKIISTFKTKVVRSFDVKQGEPLGYGSVVTPKAGRVAILNVGYGDGFNPQLQGSHLYHNGHKGVVCARVCMDMVFVLFDKGTPIKKNDEFTIWSHDFRLMEMADQSQIIPYYLVIALSTRIPRIYQLD